MSLASIVKAVNLIRQDGTTAYKEAVPYMTAKSSITDIANVLLNDANQGFLNEFIGGLFNRIALTIISNRTYDNPLSMFKKGSVPLGTDIQDIFTNPAEAEIYELSDTAMAKLLTLTDPDTKVAYYRRNRKDMYTKSLSRESLAGAFTSWQKLEDLVSSITNSLYSGNYVDEFDLTKKLISGAVDSNKVIIETVTAVTDSASAKAFVKKCRSLFSKFRFPSVEYNAYSKFGGEGKPVKTWTPSDRIALIVKADVMSEVDIEVLAQAFNLDSAKLMGRVVEVDSFENENIQAIICDEAFLQIYDNLLKFDEFYNPRTMVWNEYLHAWGVYGISPFANAVALVASAGLPSIAATGITSDLASDTLTINAGETKVFTYDIAPVNSTDTITATPSATVTADIDTIARTVTVTATADGTITLASTETPAVTKTITVDKI